MMLKWIETTGRSEEDAISAALFQLGLERDDVSVEVIERAKSGFLGFGSNPAKVRVSYEEENGVPRHRKNLLEEPVLAAASVSKPRAAAPADRPATRHSASGGSTLIRKPPRSSFTRGTAVSGAQRLVKQGW